MALPEIVFGAATFSGQYNSDATIASDIPVRTVRLALRYAAQLHHLIHPYIAEPHAPPGMASALSTLRHTTVHLRSSSARRSRFSSPFSLDHPTNSYVISCPHVPVHWLVSIVLELIMINVLCMMNCICLMLSSSTDHQVRTVRPHASRVRLFSRDDPEERRAQPRAAAHELSGCRVLARRRVRLYPCGPCRPGQPGRHARAGEERRIRTRPRPRGQSMGRRRPEGPRRARRATQAAGRGKS